MTGPVRPVAPVEPRGPQRRTGDRRQGDERREGEARPARALVPSDEPPAPLTFSPWPWCSWPSAEPDQPVTALMSKSLRALMMVTMNPASTSSSTITVMRKKVEVAKPRNSRNAIRQTTNRIIDRA